MYFFCQNVCLCVVIQSDGLIHSCTSSVCRSPDIALPAAFTVLPSPGVRVDWQEMGPEHNEAIAARVYLSPGVASIELSFPCPSSDQGRHFD